MISWPSVGIFFIGHLSEAWLPLESNCDRKTSIILGSWDGYVKQLIDRDLAEFNGFCFFYSHKMIDAITTSILGLYTEPFAI